MLKSEDIIVGTKVRCLIYGQDFGAVGTINKIIGSYFYVYDILGNEIGSGFSNTDDDRKNFDLEIEGDRSPINRSIPLRSSSFKINTPVVCAFRRMSAKNDHFYGMVGKITSIRPDGIYLVAASNGELIGEEGWSEMASFRALLPMSVPLTKDNRVVGTRVVCVYAGDNFGKIGTIAKVNQSGSYQVKEDGGDIIGGTDWSYLESFEMLVENGTITYPAVVIENVTVQTTSPSTGTCPAYYYGIRACTCGKCSSAGMLRF